jgi:UDP-N-acetylmuramoyl-L-alanyl-D-glutamate--2,6-diaminopimelate ligase
MQLGDLLSVRLAPEVAAITVTSVQIDSRHCRDGSLFFALPGDEFDGARFADDAVQRGAVAVVASNALDIDVPCIVVKADQLHELMVSASSAVVAHPEDAVTLVGVTGTNGKTSVTTVLAALWRQLGHSAEVVGTLTHERTTPASPELFRAVAAARDNAAPLDRALLALEVSSHALSQGRVDGLIFDVAAFTNLSLDHLDYHGTMEKYFSAKASLFVPARCRHAVIWVDDAYGKRLAQSLEVPSTLVARADADDVTYAVGETTFSWRGQSVRTSLSGQYNLDNSLIVLAIAVALGASEADAAIALSSASSVPGRFEVVSRHHPIVIVDYAHTPDGLERLLRDVRELTRAQHVTVVFGCGGDRDRSKRPVMGDIATRLADRTILTSDNPRSENPESILDDIVSGIGADTTWERISDRRSAISAALAGERSNSVVVIAGKGHESTQTVGDVVTEFDDRVVARELLEVGGR